MIAPNQWVAPKRIMGTVKVLGHTKFHTHNAGLALLQSLHAKGTSKGITTTSKPCAKEPHRVFTEDMIKLQALQLGNKYIHQNT